MMEAILPHIWKEEFALAASARREELSYKDRMARFEFADRQRKDQERDLAEEKQDREAMTEIVLATQPEIAAFCVDLDAYDTGTVEALMDNQEALAVVREKIDTMLREAEVLPDSRRVFKTKDGQRVFDEHGQELSPEIIDPNSIDNKRPKWETFAAEKQAENRLVEEREQLSTYQAKLDEARERANSGEMSRQELEQYEVDLKADMPDAVRAKVGLERSDQPADPINPAAAPIMPNNMDTLMHGTGFVPVP